MIFFSLNVVYEWNVIEETLTEMTFARISIVFLLLKCVSYHAF